MSVIKIGNAGGFWGDDPAAPLRLARQAADLDVLTIDYLAEVSLSILAKQRDRGGPGYPKDALHAIRSLMPLWQEGRQLSLVTNGGGLDPAGLAEAARDVMVEAGVHRKLAAVTGDDVLAMVCDTPESDHFRHLETGRPLKVVLDRLITANAYVGAGEAAAAIGEGADLVLTGRLADPSMAVAPAMARFGWAADDWACLAGATVAGHLIECGQQVCGGISTDWLDLADKDCGYPIVEVAEDGSCVVTKPAGTGGAVTELTVKEQLLYELGDPFQYLSPDCTVSFLTLDVERIGNDRVRVAGATGSPPSEVYKVSAAYRDGYRCTGQLAFVNARAKDAAHQSAELVLRKLERDARAPRRWNAEVIGDDERAILRLGIADDDRGLCETFSRLIAPLVTGGPPGTTGYADGRPPVREVVSYWPCLIPRERVTLTTTFFES